MTAAYIRLLIPGLFASAVAYSLTFYLQAQGIMRPGARVGQDILHRTTACWSLAACMQPRRQQHSPAILCCMLGSQPRMGLLTVSAVSDMNAKSAGAIASLLMAVCAVPFNWLLIHTLGEPCAASLLTICTA